MEKIISLLEKKSVNYNEFLQLTKSISSIDYDDSDKIDDILNKRQNIIDALNDIDSEISREIPNLDVEIRQTVTEILDNENDEILPFELDEMREKVKQNKEAETILNKAEIEARKYVSALRDNAYNELVNSRKNLQTIDYATPNATGNLYNGSKFATKI